MTSASQPPEVPSAAPPDAGRLLVPEDPGVDVYCPECDYNLRGIASDRCPWCGWVIDIDVLIRALSEPLAWRRKAAIACGLLLGLGLLVVFALTAGGTKRLTPWEGLALLAVLLAAGGHFAVATLSWLRVRPWPMRNGETARILRFVAVLSLSAAVVGAAGFLRTNNRPAMVRGVTVTKTLEFALAASFFTLPGWSLLAMCLVCFRETTKGASQPSTMREVRHPSIPAKAPFVVEVAGRYDRAQLTQSWTDSPLEQTPQMREAIEAAWATALASARETGRILYDAPLGRLVGVRYEPTSLHLRLGPTTYREFVGTNGRLAARLPEQGSDGLADPLGLSATVLTRDGYLAFGRRSDRVNYYAGYIHTFGGMLEEADRLVAGGYDVFGSMRRELQEELHLDEAAVTGLIVTGLIRDQELQQPELLFEVSASLKRSDLAERWQKASEWEEHTGIEFVFDEPEAVLAFLLQQGRLAPVAQAALLLHGRHGWGTEWYEQTCFVLYGEIPLSLPNA